MTPILELRGLECERSGGTVLRGIDLVVEPGELCLVTGPNGAGKSTLVECIAGLRRPSVGEVLLDGREVGSWSTAARIRGGLGYVPEGRRLFPGLTVDENLRVAARAWGLPRRERRDAIERALATFPLLAGRIRTPVGALSGGERQLVAIARALLAAPRLVVLDEPSFGLAPASWAEVARWCRELADGDRAVLITEQRFRDIASFGDRTLVFDGGRLVATTADEAAATYFPGRGDE